MAAFFVPLLSENIGGYSASNRELVQAIQMLCGAGDIESLVDEIEIQIDVWMVCFSHEVVNRAVG